MQVAVHFFSSDLKRSLETAKIIGDALGPNGLDPQPMPALREMSWGEADGLSWDDMTSAFGVPSGQDKPFAPSGESWNQFVERARSGLRQCASKWAGTTLGLACHTGIIEASFIEFAGLTDRSQRFAMRPRNTSITTWVTLADREDAVWRLEGYNDAGHLWADGLFRHRGEDFRVLSRGKEPFWVALEQR